MQEVESNLEIHAQMPKTLSRKDLRRVRDFWTGGPERRLIIGFLSTTAISLLIYYFSH